MSQLPFVSVIVPAYNAAHLLERTLGAIAATDYPREHWELVVVDDGSTDETLGGAARYADVVVRLPGRPRGPAYARNRGVESSRGELVMFFDADVVIRPDTVRRYVQRLAAHPDVGAVFGSYDDAPADPGFMSQYRNLLHHFTHQRNAGDVETFWAGAGAIRRSVFEAVGMFDEWHFPRPQIEDIELGGRIRDHGVRILLSPDIQVTHLKRWTLWGVVRTDLLDRGVPWARLLAHRRSMISSTSLNLRWTEKLNTILVWAAALLAAGAIGAGAWWPLAVAAGCLLGVVVTSAPLFTFLARTRGAWFALRSIPAHVLYYLLNGVSFGLGLLLHQAIGAPLPDPTTAAYAEVGVKRWPPVPSQHRPSSWRAPEA